MRLAKVSSLPRLGDGDDIGENDVFYIAHQNGFRYDSYGLPIKTFIDWLTSVLMQMDSVTFKVWNDQIGENEEEEYAFVLQLSENGSVFPEKYCFIFPNGQKEKEAIESGDTSIKTMWEIIDIDNCKIFNGATWDVFNGIIDRKCLGKELNVRFSPEYKKILSYDEFKNPIPLRYMRYTFIRKSDAKIASDGRWMITLDNNTKWESAIYTGISKGFPLEFSQYLSSNNPTYNDTTKALSDIIGSASIK